MVLVVVGGRHRGQRCALVLLAAAALSVRHALAFANAPRGSRALGGRRGAFTGGSGGHRGDGGNHNPPIFGTRWEQGDDGRGPPRLNSIGMGITNATQIGDANDDGFQEGRRLRSCAVRGGAGERESSAPARSKTIFGSLVDALRNARARVGEVFEPKEVKEQRKLLMQLKTMPIQAVSVPNTTILPKEVVRSAVVRSGLLGSPLRADIALDISGNLKQWYMLKGYILAQVTGAKLHPDGTAELEVSEPTISESPLKITFCKQMVVDNETGEPISLKKYKEKRARSGLPQLTQADMLQLNTTYIETRGRTRPSKVAKALELSPGSLFCWKGDRWRKVASSGVFAQVLQVVPRILSDGTAQLQLYVTEPPPRHLEYGVGKSLYTGGWEGEIDFEHSNLFGGGETAGLVLRRGTKDIEPSVRLRYSDEKFGLEGGFDVELFTEFIGDPAIEDPTIEQGSYDQDLLLDRKGATFRLRNPIDPSKIHNSMASVSLERTSTRTGKHEAIASSSLTLGPFIQHLPYGARSNIVTTVSGGGRATENKKYRLLPFSTISSTTRQILPITSSSQSSINYYQRPPMTLAMQHTLTLSTPNMPRHELSAISIATQIRGASPGPRVSNSIKGTTELRFPIEIPRAGSGVAVIFADWFYAQSNPSTPYYSKASIGVGLRKNIQGFPLKCDVCYTPEGIKSKVGIGYDFDV